MACVLTLIGDVMVTATVSMAQMKNIAVSKKIKFQLSLFYVNAKMKTKKKTLRTGLKIISQSLRTKHILFDQLRIYIILRKG